MKRITDALETETFRRGAHLFVRVALATAFLSAVADRFGLWGGFGTPNVAWGNFTSFVEFTGVLLPFLPPAAVHAAAVTATALEVVLGVGLLIGRNVRLLALASALLLLSFATSMTFSLGPESALSYSVWTAAGAALLLAATTDAAE